MVSIIESNIIGQSDAITGVKILIEMNAQYPAPVLITGETGTGKELAARGLHYSGVLADKPFIAINCSTFTDDLFISELFGYSKGAFTDAKCDKQGLLVAADGGSIFFDEIDSLSLKAQTSILRLLQESEFRPLGSNQVIKANVRIIAAANTSLTKLIKSGEFRQDLYFRLFILTVNMPPLRQRKEDIVLLIQHFIEKFNSEYGQERTGISADLLEKMQQHSWPGNVRELENTIHRYYLTCNGPMLNDIPMFESEKPRDKELHMASLIEACSMSLEPDQTDVETEQAFDWLALESSQLEPDIVETNCDFGAAKRRAIEVFEAQFVAQLLQQANGNVTKAAKLCGKERRAFGKLVKKYNIKQCVFGRTLYP